MTRNSEKKKANPTVRQEVEEAQKSIENMFIFEGKEDPLELEKFIRCISYVMEYSCDGGNMDCDPFVVYGLSVALRRAADPARQLFSRSEIYSICDGRLESKEIDARLLKIKAERHE